MANQLPLALPPTEPAFDIAPYLAELDKLPMTCPYCGTTRVMMVSSIIVSRDQIETWLCYACNEEFDGWDEIPQPMRRSTNA